MNLKNRAALSIILLILISTGIYAYVPKSSSSLLPETYCNSPLEVTKLYFDSVNRGELKVFNKKLESSMLIPVRVSYTYELNQAIPKINEYKVYSKLKKPINISNSQTEGLPMISGINAIMDETGKIIKTELHIWHDKNHSEN